MKPGDPSPRSPAETLHDPAYRMVEASTLPGGQYVRLTVVHCGTETLWQCEYQIFNSSMGTKWWEVRKKLVTRIEYQRVP